MFWMHEIIVSESECMLGCGWINDKEMVAPMRRHLVLEHSHV